MTLQFVPAELTQYACVHVLALLTAFHMREHRYAGYCAWRGIVESAAHEEVANQVRGAYTQLGRAMYFDISQRGHTVLYEVPGGRLNWMW